GRRQPLGHRDDRFRVGVERFFLLGPVGRRNEGQFRHSAQASNGAPAGGASFRLGRVPEVETVLDGAVLTITLNRPDVLNALKASTLKELGAALKEARADDVRAVVIAGAGRGFCVGQDLTEFKDSAGDIGTRLRGNYHPPIKAIRSLEKPVIAAVYGAAAGTGLSHSSAFQP